VTEQPRRDRCADKGDDEHDDDEDAADERHLVGLQPTPDLLPVAARLDGLGRRICADRGLR
jgi:hypothetical protein